VRLPCLAQKERGSLSKWSAAASYAFAAFSAGPGAKPDEIFDLQCAYSLADDDFADDRSRRVNRRFDRIHNHATDRSAQPKAGLNVASIMNSRSEPRPSGRISFPIDVIRACREEMSHYHRDRRRTASVRGGVTGMVRCSE
jgi:hypothetical protein